MRENVIRRIAGTFILISAALAYFVNINWLWFTIFVGFNLLQSSFTGFCPLTKILDKLNIAREEKC